MARSINKLFLFGNLGRDPDVRALPSGGSVTTFSVATSSSGGKGKEEVTQWHTCVAWSTERSKLGDLAAQLLQKGTGVIVEGELRYRKWTDKEGKERTSAEVHVREFTVAGNGRPAAGGEGASAPASAPKAAASAQSAFKQQDAFEDFPPALGADEDDLPF